MKPSVTLAALIALTWLLSGTHGAEPEAAAKPKHTNRLAQETSPYLLQHAHNPVDWYPWGEEALAKAKKENKLIFLSVGYSSCHWCHVMERESFLDDEIAKLMNEHFVCIKVDREERPDIDGIYMTALHVYQQLAGGRRGGGWPMSMFLTPEAEPIFGGTYFPARDGDRHEGSTGFLTIVKTIQGLWAKSPERIREDAKAIAKFTKAELENRRGALTVPLDDALVASVQEALAEQYDERYGGFGFDLGNPARPKFPEPSNLVFLVDRVRRAKDEQAKTMLVGTLERMSLGGIRDHLGGGFHRYSVDRYWSIPHFEKMLYDNGQLASVYAQAHELTGRDDFRRVTIELCDFILREMTDETGGFYAALDAESEHEEGKFYRWDNSEVEQALTPEEFALFAFCYGLDGDPNFEEKYYAPQLPRTLDELASQKKLTEAELEAQLVPIRKKLFDLRAKRPRPLTDTKILTADNGLMIGGLADAGRILKEPRYLEAAARSAEFVLTKLRQPDGRLYRTYGGGQAKLNGYLNDYAFLADGLIRLYQATGDKRWAGEADAITQKQIELFADDMGSAFFFTSKDHEALLARTKELTDNALPAGNSIAATNLIFLAVELKKPEYLSRASKTVAATAAILQNSPGAAPWMATAIPALADARSKLKAEQ